MAFFVFVKMGKAPLSRALSEIKAAFMRTNFTSLLDKTNRFHVAVHLSSNSSQRTSKRGNNISGKLAYRLVCHLFVLTTF